MEWRRNGIEVGVDDDEVFTSFRDGVARLRLRDVQPQHAGEYVCQAKNEGGSVQCSSRVTVKGKQMEFAVTWWKIYLLLLYKSNAKFYHKVNI